MPPIRRPRPTWNLDDVQLLVQTARVGPKVIKRAWENCDLELEREVVALIRQCARKLMTCDFAYSELQSYDGWSIYADIYAFENEHGKWFMKFYIKDGQLIIASCHAPERDTTLADKRVIKAI